MNKINPLSILIILVIAGAAVWFLYPSVTFYMQPPEKRREIIKNHPDVLKKVINLGLDLQGGLRLVLEVDRSNLSKDEEKDILDRAYAVIENRVNKYGVAEPTIQKQGSDRLIVELPGIQDRNTAIKVIKSTAQLEFKLLREIAERDKAFRVIEKVVSGKKVIGDTTVESTDTSIIEEKEAQEQAEDLFAGRDLSEDTSKTQELDTVQEVKDIFTPTSFIDYTVGIQGSPIPAVQEKDKDKVEAILARKDVNDELKKAGLSGSEFLWGHEIIKFGGKEYRNLYYLKRKAELKGNIIKDARWEIARGGLQAGQAIVNLEMNREGARRFSRVTGVNTHKFLAIILDSTVYSAPQIREKIPQGRAQITGSFSNEEAKGLAIILRAGALPAPVKIIEERTVGPSLGQDSIRKAVNACILGFILIVLFMIIYYRGAGVIANGALILNLILVLAILASFGLTLTLPGIAGLILTIGMAIDANVIIFERIREELAIGKTIRSAVDAGYSRAFVTIMDANITTLFTAAILLWVGTGPVKGFAVVMIIGIIVSLITALFITRVVFNMITASRSIKKLSI